MKKEERLGLIDSIITAIQTAKFPLGGTIADLHIFTEGLRNICSALLKLKESIDKDEVKPAEPSKPSLAMVPKEGDV